MDLSGRPPHNKVEIHGNCTDMHNGLNNENHGNATHKIVLIPVHSLYS